MNLGYKILVVENSPYSLEATCYNVLFGKDYYDEVHVIGYFHRVLNALDVNFYHIPIEIRNGIAFHIFTHADLFRSCTHVTYLGANIVIPYEGKIEYYDGSIVEVNYGSPIANSNFLINPFVLLDEIPNLKEKGISREVYLMYNNRLLKDIVRLLDFEYTFDICPSYLGNRFFTSNCEGLVEASRLYVSRYGEMIRKMGNYVDFLWHIILSNTGGVGEEMRSHLLAAWGGYEENRNELLNIMRNKKPKEFEKIRKAR